MAITLPESAKKLLSTPMSDEKKEIEPSSSDPMTVAIETSGLRVDGRPFWFTVIQSLEKV